ncbi:DNA-binding protein [Nitzschia inconspicua]|uniref:DNA-binding protein n=1 Tax=Nitzschia inconspicua TaxID=303405 RepID=A0A9K3PVS7_9STRA|nr:DNA-binding protein [Nitzschia inconspicua]
MPPRKRKSTAKKGKESNPSKKAREDPKEGLDAADSPSTTATTLPQLYECCVLEADITRRWNNVQKWEERGALSEIVWPFLRDHPESKEFFHGCYLLILFISHHFTEGAFSDGGSTFLDFVGPADEKTIHIVLETLLRKTDNKNYELQTRIVHFIDVAVCRSAGKHDPWMKAILMHVSGIDLWHYMPERRRELELKGSAGLRRKFSNSTKEEKWIVTNICSVLDLLEGKTEYGSLIKFQADETLPAPSDVVQQDVWLFLHRSLELLIDLLSLESARLFLVSYLESIDFSVRCRLAVGNEFAIPENLRLVQYLLTKVNSLLVFPIQDTTHKSLSKVDMISLHHDRATTLQKIAYRHYPRDLQQVIYSGVGLLCADNTAKNSYLERSFVGFSDDQLTDLLYRLRLIPDNEKIRNRKYMLQVLANHLYIPPYPTDQLKAYPLYPTEGVLWDLSVIPASSFQLRATQVLALPKLNSQYLSFQDYLIRNFELVRLESAYEIRSDIVNVVKRVRPVLRQTSVEDEDDILLKTEFNGWSRMALELTEPAKITEVRPPKLGEITSSQVTLEFTVDLEPCGQSIRREWDEVGEFDNLFLLCIDASKMSGSPAPLLKDFHLHHGAHRIWDTDNDERRVPEEEDGSFPARFGIDFVRGCMVMSVRNENGTILSDPGISVPEKEQKSTKRIFRVAMDPAQYSTDSRNGGASDMYQRFNLVMRRAGRENNFKSVLETIRGLMSGAGSIGRVLPKWLQSLLLGTSDPTSASYHSESIKTYAMQTVGVNKPSDFLDFGDTFLNEEHLRASFKGKEVIVDGRETTEKETNERYDYKIRFSSVNGEDRVEAISMPSPKGVIGNPVRFTPLQVEAVRSGLSPGLTLVVGPPGTGKTDCAVQIISSLYHSFPTQRTVVVTHSNAALNDIFQKVMERGDVDERYMVRLGSGERDLKTESTHDFTKIGRVTYSMQRRDQLLEQVQRLSESLNISGKAQRGADGSPSYTCETASYFKKLYIERRKKEFEKAAMENGVVNGEDDATPFFPFRAHFQIESVTMKDALEHFATLEKIFDELSEYRPFELLRTQRQRANYLISKQARIVAMTCTHAAIARSNLIELGFEYDNIVMEESGQMLEIESFIPMLLQKGSSDDSVSGKSRLKRLCMLGDHNQLPPVVKNSSFSKYSNFDQSMFTRLIHLGVPYIQLDKQGRARPEILRLYSWRYKNLGSLSHVIESHDYRLANPGFLHTFQVINVEDFDGKGETTPTPYFYQNLGEAEYAVALFQYMVLIGYAPERISILTTYNGQKELISDVISQRCGVGTPLEGIRPKAISTVDQYQGQQNDIVLLSLVRTKTVGHLRDIRRLVVAVSRAKFGLYVFCRQELFASCHELKRTMEQFASRSNKLQLVLGETYPTDRTVDGEVVDEEKVFQVEDVSHLGSIVHSMQQDLMAQSEDPPDQ